MAKKNDSVAKKAFKEKWPSWTDKWPLLDGDAIWLRAQPKTGTATCPQLHMPGTKSLWTRPDGMWVLLHAARQFCDVICVEDCSSLQNLNDKRSRYIHAHHSLVLTCPQAWLLEAISYKKGTKERWDIARTFVAAPTTDPVLPVRHLRVIYSLGKDDYRNVQKNLVPAAHEYFCKHSSLASYQSPKMQTFLGHMWLGNHFYTQR